VSDPVQFSGARVPPPDGERQHLEVHPERLLHDWKAAHERAVAYLQALGVPEEERSGFASRAVKRALAHQWEGSTGAIPETLRAVKQLVRERWPAALDANVDAFVGWRIDRALAGRHAAASETGLATKPVRDGAVRSGPPISRRRMVPEPIERRFVRRFVRRKRRRRRVSSGPVDHVLFGRPLRQLRRRLPWTGVAHRRRLLLMALVAIPTTVASGFMVNVLPHQGGTWLETAITVFFGALFGWISIGFWTAMFGFFTLLRRDRFAITNLEPATGEGVPAAAAPREGADTAIVMPVCDEPVERVIAGLRAIHASLARAGALDRFHFFILSDTAPPTSAMKEEEAWFEWCRATDGFDRIFYRRRKVRLERKSGNVADFCRRWGRRYRYMISLDADSVMTASTVVRLTELMDRHPDVGMIQTAPTAVNRRSLFARVQQFASRVYGPMFAAGLHYWQLGDGQYWGHNTILRIEPFMDHCSLPRLPGREPLGGEILSHDFVEAALMGRAGWSIWLAYDLDGSWEEVPSTLLEEMKRDRRWCQGNLQHLRLLFTEGLFGAHRALFINGALSYVSALLWNTFLGLSTIAAIREVFWPPGYFPNGPSLFPEWPIWRPDWMLALVGVIGTILFLPKVLSIVLILVKGKEGARPYGGAVKLTLSVLLEILVSSFLAPIRMVFHSRYVMMNLIGRTVGWRSSGRGDDETGWRESFRHHGLDTFVASVWGTVLFWLSPGYFWWVTPIVGALILSVPLSVFMSRVRFGNAARRRGLFLIPEESHPPEELRDLATFAKAAEQATAALPEKERDGFVRAVVDPYLNAIHRALQGQKRTLRQSIRTARRALMERALADGPTSLNPRERRILLMDPDATDDLHRRVWELPDRDRAARWGRPGTPANASP
jgi:membrane glycosyltransferase